MKRGFNRYSEHEQDESSQNDHNNQNHFPVLNNPLFSQLPAGNSDALVMALFQIVEQQSRALQGLVAKVERISSRTLELSERIQELKQVDCLSRRGKRDDHEVEGDGTKKEVMKVQAGKGGDILQAASLIRILFGADKHYEYRLQLAKKLELPIYRERNFFLEIELKDREGRTIRNTNKIPMSLALYSSENPPKFIEKNTAGQKILKGYIEQSLHQGSCHFEKIQIKQVTSHFRNGWVYIVIIPSMTPLGSCGPNSDCYIDYTKIEPLVLDRIVVKAKKLKTRKPGEENEVEEHVKVDGEKVEEEVKMEEEHYDEGSHGSQK